MGDLGLVPDATSAEDLKHQIASEIQTWTAVAKAKSIKAD